VRTLVLAVTVLAASAAAYGQVGEISVSGGGAKFGGGSPGVADPTTNTEVKVNGGFRFDIRLTLNSYRFFGHEFGYGYSRSTYKVPDDVSVPMHQGYYDFLVYATPEGAKIRPLRRRHQSEGLTAAGHPLRCAPVQYRAPVRIPGTIGPAAPDRDYRWSFDQLLAGW
jgi:hypothetical protein